MRGKRQRASRMMGVGWGWGLLGSEGGGRSRAGGGRARAGGEEGYGRELGLNEPPRARAQSGRDVPVSRGSSLSRVSIPMRIPLCIVRSLQTQHTPARSARARRPSLPSQPSPRLLPSDSSPRLFLLPSTTARPLVHHDLPMCHLPALLAAEDQLLSLLPSDLAIQRLSVGQRHKRTMRVWLLGSDQRTEEGFGSVEGRG